MLLGIRCFQVNQVKPHSETESLVPGCRLDHALEKISKTEGSSGVFLALGLVGSVELDGLPSPQSGGQNHNARMFEHTGAVPMSPKSHPVLVLLSPDSWIL